MKATAELPSRAEKAEPAIMFSFICSNEFKILISFTLGAQCHRNRHNLESEPDNFLISTCWLRYYEPVIVFSFICSNEFKILISFTLILLYM